MPPIWFYEDFRWHWGFPCGSGGKNLPAMQETWVQSLGWEDPLEKGMATHSRILAWKIPWTEEPGGLQSMEWQRVGHNWSKLTHMHTFLYSIKLFWRGIEENSRMGKTGEGNGNPLQYPCLENPMDRGAWWAAIHGVAELDMTEWLHFHFSLSCIGEGNGNPLKCSCLKNPMDGRAL